MCEYTRGGHKKGVNIEWGRGGGVNIGGGGVTRRE